MRRPFTTAWLPSTRWSRSWPGSCAPGSVEGGWPRTASTSEETAGTGGGALAAGGVLLAGGDGGVIYPGRAWIRAGGRRRYFHGGRSEV